VEHAAVSDITLALVHQRLIPGEQVVWAGKPEPTVPLAWPSRSLVPTVKFTLPVFVLGLIVGIAIGRPILYVASLAGILLYGFVILGSKIIRAMPVAHEEYVLTNWRAFAHFQSNGTRIFGEMLLDGDTLIRQRRCGHGTTTLDFSRSQKTSEPRKVKGLVRAHIGFLNLRDAEYPMKLAEWVVGANAAYRASASAVSTHREQAWTKS